MRKWPVILALLFSPLAMAETLTPDLIKQLHDQVKTNFFDGCSKNVTGSLVEVCRCVADKAQASLDDTALAKCNNDESGKDCVVNAVKAATAKASSTESVDDCKKKAADASGG